MYRGVTGSFAVALTAIAVASVGAQAANAAPAEPPAASKLADPVQALTPDEQERLCARGLALVKADLVPAAQTLYEQLLGRADCAPAIASAIEQRQESAKAKAKVKTDTSTKFNTAIDEVEALQREGFDTEARAKLEKVVAEYPDRDIPNGLRQPDQQLSGWRTLLGDVGPAVVTLLQFLAVLLAVVAGFVVAVYALTRLRARWKLAIEIRPFDGDDDDGTLEASIQDRLERLASTRQSAAILNASSSDGEFKLPATVASAVPQASLIEGLASMLDRLLPRTVRRVEGTALPEDPVRGAGITIAISDRRGGALDRVTLFEADYELLPKADKNGKRGDLAWRRTRLAIPAATWLAYNPELASEAAEPKLGTTEWRSYAFFAVGELVHREGDEATARKLYMRALDIDPQNLGATLNLASLRLHDAEALPPVAEQLEAVRAVTDHTSSLWYRATYLLAVTHLYAKDADAAGKLLDKLSSEIEAHRDGPLQPLLTALEMPARVARASATAIDPNGEQPDISFLPTWRSGATQYNLACFYARWSQRPGASDEETSERKRMAIVQLTAAIQRLGTPTKAWAAGDPGLAALRDMPEWPSLVKADPGANASSDGSKTPLVIPVISFRDGAKMVPWP